MSKQIEIVSGIMDNEQIISREDYFKVRIVDVISYQIEVLDNGGLRISNSSMSKTQINVKPVVSNVIEITPSRH